jgi:hypothetical protein
VDGAVYGWWGDGWRWWRWWLGGVGGACAEKENATCAASSRCFGQIGRIDVYVQVHVAGVISECGVWMGCGVVEQMRKGLCRGLGAWVPSDCCEVMVPRVTNMVESMARP